MLEPLAPFRDRHARAVSGLDNRPALALPGEPAAAMARIGAAFLTGVHAKPTEGADFQAGMSIDQIAAPRARAAHAAASLELALEATEFARRLRRRLQLRLHEHDLLAQSDHAAADGEQPARGVRAAVRRQRQHRRGARAARLRADRSILDSVTESGAACSSGSARATARSCRQYLEAIRDVERRGSNLRIATASRDRAIPGCAAVTPACRSPSRGLRSDSSGLPLERDWWFSPRNRRTGARTQRASCSIGTGLVGPRQHSVVV